MGKNRYHDITDDELLQRFWQTQNNEWLGVLLQRYTLLVLGVCIKYLKNETEARDGVQQIFLKTIQELGKYKIDHFKSWLYMVAKNHCLTILRSKKGKIPVALTDLNAPQMKQGDDTHNLKEDILSHGLLESALKELNEEQRESVTLFYLKKKSYQEISNITGYSLLQVKSYIQNGKRNLKLHIEKKLKEANIKNA